MVRLKRLFEAMAARLSVNLIGTGLGSAGGYGWALDARLIAETLCDAGFDVTAIDANLSRGDGFRNHLAARLRREWQGLRHRAGRGKDLNIFLERVPHQMFAAARRQVLIPNQEWFMPKWQRHLGRFDAVICKTRAAEEIFSRLGCRTRFSSFTSQDKRQPGFEPKRREFLFVLGKRTSIGERVLDVWARHPEWPQLVLVGHKITDVPAPSNVRLIRTYIPDEEVARLQNGYLFHLAVTAAEGFGHKLSEGLSCGAIVITTDAPPMNELITRERGFLVEWDRSEPKCLGTEYHFSAAGLEKTVEACLRASPVECEMMAQAARTWFESNDRFFRRALPELLREISTSGK
jgi:hypothetical protein